MNELTGLYGERKLFNHTGQMKNPEVERAVNALNFIIPTLNKYQFKWAITGGFACLAYGIDRPLTDIDIDIYTSTNSLEFKSFLKDVGPYTTQPLEHFVDENYDNYNVEITYQGLILDICPMDEMNVFNKSSGTYENFYRDGFPEIELIHFHDLELPLLSKELIIKNKEMLAWQRELDHRDIAWLRELLKTSS